MRKTLAVKRAEAAMRGLEFIYHVACDAESFEDYGHDFLFCFYTIASNSRDDDLRRKARRMGRELARVWRDEHPTVPERISAYDLSNMVVGSDAADRLGVRDEKLKPRIRRALREFAAEDFYGFDPSREPPRDDVPEDCECGADNRTGRKNCRRCGRPLEMIGRYGVWIDALVMTYLAERYGVVAGAPYKDALKWRPHMLPYRGAEGGENPDYYWTVYAVTHVVYTLNHYNVYQLSPGWLPEEFEFLLANLDEAIAQEDPEMTGEFLDCLKAFGLGDDHPLIRKGTRYLLSKQNEDGGWGVMNAEHTYQRYHPAFTVVNGLRDIAWRGQRLSFPKLKSMLSRPVSKIQA
ncbi:MAG TPA: hypothetical protein VJT09_14020 [Pyrinomonadaceae bacterium]|nr:hypothetical protein [Pyrinomonadaceae bacterium]